MQPFKIDTKAFKDKVTYLHKNYFSKIFWLILAAVFVGVFEILSLSGVALPKEVALPLFSVFTVAFGYQTIFEGLKAFAQFNFKSINLLMVIAVFGAFYLEEYPEGAIVIILFTLAEKLEDVGIKKSQSALDALLDQMPKQVFVKDFQRSMNVKDVKTGAVVVVKPSEMIALDGKVLSGNTFVDESAITGEPIAVDKSKGDFVYAGTLNRQGVIEVVVTKEEDASTLSKIRELTFNAMEYKADTQKFIETFSTYYTPSMMALAASWTVFPWLFFGKDFLVGFQDALTLLVISCPCALVISTPVSIFSAIGNASKEGVLIKGGKYLEAIGQIKAIGMDKTKTLTYGRPLVTDIIPYGNHTKEHLLSCAAGIELFSEHPLAESIIKAAEKEKLTPHEVVKFQSVVGKGAKAECLVCNSKHHCIGKLAFILEEHKVPDDVIQIIESLQAQGKTVLLISTTHEIEGMIALRDEIRKDSKELINSLHKLGIKSVMLTGDHKRAADAIAESLSIDEVKADLLPEDKKNVIEELIVKYGKVAMFGDGVNDAPALATSHVGISMSSLGSDTAIEAASIILLNDNLKLIPYLVKLGSKMLFTIKVNTLFSVFVKALFIILAILGLSNLAFAIFADVGVTLLVIFNSLRLLKFKPF